MNPLISDFLVVAVVGAYLGISALIAYLLSDKKRGEPPTQIEGQNNSSATGVSEPIAIRIINAPPTSDDQKQYEQKNYRLQRRSFVVGFITLAVLIGYTGINWLLYQTTSASFQAQERPWVGPDTEQSEIKPLAAGEVPQVTLVLNNFGHSPALRTAYKVIGTVVPKDTRYNMTGDEILERIHRFTEHKYGTVWPNERFSESVISTGPITADQIRAMSAYGYPAFYVVIGLVTYNDTTSPNITHHTWIFLIYASDLQTLVKFDTDHLPDDD